MYLGKKFIGWMDKRVSISMMKNRETKPMKRKYIKRKCSYWEHSFVYLGTSNRLSNGNRIRFCIRCQKHFEHVGGGVLLEEAIDLLETTLKDFPKGILEGKREV